MIVAKGNTYKAKESLKKMGFKWNAEKKEWTAESVDLKEWEEKHLNPSYIGRKWARLNREANIEFVEI